VVYVEMPEIGLTISEGEEAGVVESVKAASDIYAPVRGEVIEVNPKLDDAPETVNEDPYGEGWFFKIQPSDIADLDELLDAESYAEVCDAEDH
jgi:glycine cleavage system H protein